jgi:hypothetical protein
MPHEASCLCVHCCDRSKRLNRGCQIFVGTWYPNRKKCTKWSYNFPNVLKTFQIHQHFPFQGPQKFTQIGIFGLKTNHLATLDWIAISSSYFRGLWTHDLETDVEPNRYWPLIKLHTSYIHTSGDRWSNYICTSYIHTYIRWPLIKLPTSRKCFRFMLVRLRTCRYILPT